MTMPSSRNLSHDFPAYKGLTLREMFLITVSTTSCTCLVFILFGLLTGWVVAFGCIGFLCGFILSLTVVPTPIARLKSGKPHAYLKKKVFIAMSAFVKSPYLGYRGLWKKSQRVRSRHV